MSIDMQGVFEVAIGFKSPDDIPDYELQNDWDFWFYYGKEKGRPSANEIRRKAIEIVSETLQKAHSFSDGYELEDKIRREIDNHVYLKHD